MEPSQYVDAQLLKHLRQYCLQFNTDFSSKDSNSDLSPSRWAHRSELNDLIASIGKNHGVEALLAGANDLAKCPLPMQRCLLLAEQVQVGLEQGLALPLWLPLATAFCWQQCADGVQLLLEASLADEAAAFFIVWLLGCYHHAIEHSSGIEVHCPVSWHKALGDMPVVLRPSEQWRLQWSKERLRVPSPSGDELQYQAAVRGWRRETAKLQQHVELYLELSAAIADNLQIKPLNQEDLAQQFGFTVRNLQRRLQALGTSYQSLVDDCRKSLALRLIAEHHISLHELAFRIGYTEPSAFFKAFRRWTGMTPGRYRQQQASKEVVTCEAHDG